MSIMSPVVGHERGIEWINGVDGGRCGGRAGWMADGVGGGRAGWRAGGVDGDGVEGDGLEGGQGGGRS
ncbi:hypothetical protein GUJ93_ZPchr0012g19308 [Zizania palustris]|uniref:Uncharacterized protein n=1 Tax=Zizania palustris TaxID=103762 RepID=A0A8J5WQR1_ZIZPA|nr:hypothetical protein GUJ93_ZPchr0012g19308 [Zizania palustris]